MASLIASGPYDSEALSLAARISQKMGDPAEAGRYWMLTPETGEAVDAAVVLFARGAGNDARCMASRLPRFRGRDDLDQYPEAVRARLATHGIEAVLRERQPPESTDLRGRTRARLQLLGCLLIAMGLATGIFFALRALKRLGCG